MREKFEKGKKDKITVLKSKLNREKYDFKQAALGTCLRSVE